MLVVQGFSCTRRPYFGRRFAVGLCVALRIQNYYLIFAREMGMKFIQLKKYLAETDFGTFS
ncbi:hypothetical protein TRM7557_01640 [Tritonibacter multivorans]|uniref:Uncharacterized protein n=2 Tax=Tritonibacter multivorans TaxID=928856 RepID=A0A0P1G8E5_9RHOB|nr:hypothetical protein TRM7557_01640 [Tritonibacter multivorans]SFD10202.1 hypothetical protein SAMN04488049_1077 [Tritonibacter multivorans]